MREPSPDIEGDNARRDTLRSILGLRDKAGAWGTGSQSCQSTSPLVSSLCGSSHTQSTSTTQPRKERGDKITSSSQRHRRLKCLSRIRDECDLTTFRQRSSPNFPNEPCCPRQLHIPLDPSSSCHQKSADAPPPNHLRSLGESASNSGGLQHQCRLPFGQEGVRLGQTVATPPEAWHRGGVGGCMEGKRVQQQQDVVGGVPPAEAGRSSATSKTWKKGVARGADERLSAAELAAKKMLLPFINELSFIEIALAAVSDKWLAFPSR